MHLTNPLLTDMISKLDYKDVEYLFLFFCVEWNWHWYLALVLSIIFALLIFTKISFILLLLLENEIILFINIHEIFRNGKKEKIK